MYPALAVRCLRCLRCSTWPPRSSAANLLPTPSPLPRTHRHANYLADQSLSHDIALTGSALDLQDVDAAFVERKADAAAKGITFSGAWTGSTLLLASRPASELAVSLWLP